MPAYSYVALDDRGRKTKGRAAADSPSRLKTNLRSEGLFLVSAEADDDESLSSADAPDVRPLPDHVLSDLVERLEILVKGGIPLIESLRQMAEDTEHPAAQDVLADLARFVGSGRPLSDGLARHPRVFDESFRAAILAGETSGELDGVLATLCKKLEFRSEMRKRVRGALAYPAGLFAALIGLMALVLVVLVPKLTAVFDKARVEPPAVTRAMLATKDFLTVHGATLAVLSVFAVVAFKAGLKTRGFRRVVQGALYRTPVLSNLLVMSETAAFVGVVGLLNKYGVNVAKALEIARRAVRTERMKEGVDAVLASVVRGQGLAESVKEAGVFPPIVVQMTAVGQRSGGLDDAFARVEGFLDREIPRVARRIVGVVTPLVTVVAGLTVGVAIYSVIAPLMSVMKALKGGGG
jgi:type II secretory pathway component PulF